MNKGLLFSFPARQLLKASPGYFQNAHMKRWTKAAATRPSALAGIGISALIFGLGAGGFDGTVRGAESPLEWARVESFEPEPPK